MAKARGKIILLGEHSVVYGRPALVVGIENGAEATVHSAATSSIDIGDHRAIAGEGELGRAFEALLQALNSPPVRAQIALGIPAGCGLGASAAAGVALARAVVEVAHPHDARAQSFEHILGAANAWETVFHGKPSGIDATAATLGGCFVYTRNQAPRVVELHQPLMLAVAVADRPANTRTMVEQVATRLSAEPKRTTELFDAISELVSTGERALVNGGALSLGSLMNRNHALLSELGVSTASLDVACDAARAAGALGAKLTGSGGGGCVIALCESTTDPVLRAWKAKNLNCFEAIIQPHAQQS